VTAWHDGLRQRQVAMVALAGWPIQIGLGGWFPCESVDVKRHILDEIGARMDAFIIQGCQANPAGK